MARIENHKYSIEEAFRECFYVVPDYQREYVCTEKGVRQLLDDITEQMDSTSDKEYFVGTVLILGIRPRSTVNRRGPSITQHRMMHFHLPPSVPSISANGHTSPSPSGTGHLVFLGN